MLKKAIICLRLGSIFTLLAGFFLTYFSLVDKGIVLSSITILIIASIGLVVWYEITIRGLKNTKTWAWKSSIVIFGLFIPSLFIVLGIVGMQSVLSNTIREQFFSDNKIQNNEAKSFADVMSEAKHIKVDESIEEYIQKNDALKRYMNYKKNIENKG